MRRVKKSLAYYLLAALLGFIGIILAIEGLSQTQDNALPPREAKLKAATVYYLILHTRWERYPKLQTARDYQVCISEHDPLTPYLREVLFNRSLNGRKLQVQEMLSDNLNGFDARDCSLIVTAHDNCPQDMHTAIIDLSEEQSCSGAIYRVINSNNHLKLKADIQNAKTLHLAFEPDLVEVLWYN